MRSSIRRSTLSIYYDVYSVICMYERRIKTKRSVFENVKTITATTIKKEIVSYLCCVLFITLGRFTSSTYLHIQIFFLNFVFTLPARELG